MSTTYTQGRIQPFRLWGATFRRYLPKNFSDLGFCFEIWQKKKQQRQKSSIEEPIATRADPVGRFVERVCSERIRNQISRRW